MISLVFIPDVLGSIPDRCRAVCLSVLRATSAVIVMTRLPTGRPRLDLLHSVHTDVGANKASFSAGTGGLFSLGEKRLVCEADQSSLSTTEVNNEWDCTSVSSYTFMAYTETTILLCLSGAFRHTVRSS